MARTLFAIFLFPVSVFAQALFAQTLTISGTMHHAAIEGGCWYLRGDGGKTFELAGDSSVLNPLRVENQHVVLRVEPVKNAASICMMGEIVRVLARIDSVRYPIDLPIWPVRMDGTIHRLKSGAWYVKTRSGKRYEFKNPPDAKYRHAGMSIQETFRVLTDKKSAPDGMDGVIVSGAIEKKKVNTDIR